jgi:glycolate oxidase
MTAVAPPSQALLAALGREIPADRIVVDQAVIDGLSADQAQWAAVGRAAVAVRARSEAEVAAAVRIAAGLGVPIVTRGAGTGLSGGANAVDDCLILDLSRMTAIVEIDPENLICVVQPGVVNNDLKAVLAEQGLWYPPDPASAPWSTIGGNVATNAGGLCCLKYGVTRDYVLGLRAVVGGPAGYGTTVRLGRRTTNGVAGLDMVGLMVGSEGTLGVITEVTLRVRPALTGTPQTVVGAFGSLVDAGRGVALITRLGLTPSALELLDRTCLQAVEDWKHLGIEADAAALLLARVDTPGDAGEDEARLLTEAFEQAGALWATRSPTQSRRRRCSRPAGSPTPPWSDSARG